MSPLVDAGFLAFAVFAVITVGSAMIVAFSRNILMSGFALLGTFFGVAGLYVLLEAEFLAAVQILIYVGGILVLILFAVMLTQKISQVFVSNESTPTAIAIIACGSLFLVLAYLALNARWKTSDLELVSSLSPKRTVSSVWIEGNPGVKAGDRIDITDRGKEGHLTALWEGEKLWKLALSEVEGSARASAVEWKAGKTELWLLPSGISPEGSEQAVAPGAVRATLVRDFREGEELVVRLPERPSGRSGAAEPRPLSAKGATERPTAGPPTYGVGGGAGSKLLVRSGSGEMILEIRKVELLTAVAVRPVDWAQKISRETAEVRISRLPHVAHRLAGDIVPGEGVASAKLRPAEGAALGGIVSPGDRLEFSGPRGSLVVVVAAVHGNSVAFPEMPLPAELPAGKTVVSRKIHTSQSIGKALMSRYLLPFELVSVVLLVALIGAAYLSRKDPTVQST